MAVLIMISTFGCNNGIIFASARVYQAMAQDGLFFSKMKDNNQYGVPGNALWIQFFGRLYFVYPVNMEIFWIM